MHLTRSPRFLRPIVSPAGAFVGFTPLALIFLLCIASASLRAADRIPITTSSERARTLFLEGRDLNDRLKATDAHHRFLEAVALDSSFALAHLLAAQTSTSTNEFFEELQRSVDLAPIVSKGERMYIRGVESGAKGQAESQRDAYTSLAELYPDDERALTLLGNYYFGTLAYDPAIEQYNKATAINPSFAPPYNQLGYAYRFKKEYPRAEQAFRKYIELVPDDPNPSDSYAEFLMKTGRFEESIANYRKALAVDSTFVPSYIGIANDYMFLGKGEEARATCDDLARRARNTAEKRQAMFWKAVSLLHEHRPDDAIRIVHEMSALSETEGDLPTIAADHVMIGNILLESAGKPDEALAEFQKAVELSDKTDVPPEVKETNHRAFLYQDARVALSKDELDAALEKTNRYTVATHHLNIPAEVRQAHEMIGRLDLARGKYDEALHQLGIASDQDPRVLYLTALAYEGKGDVTNAALMADQAAHFNALSINYAYVHGAASALAEKHAKEK